MAAGTTKNSFRNRLANSIAALHVAIVVFFMFGWLLPSPMAWWATLLGGIGLQLTWLVLANQCPLTMLETYLRENVDGPMNIGAHDTAPEKPPHFVANLLSKIFGTEVSPRAGDIAVYAVLYTSMALCAWRLFG